MPNQTSKYFPVVIVIIVIALVVGIQYFKNHRKPIENSPKQNLEEQTGEAEDQNESEFAPGGGAAENQFTGTLKISDNLKRGNLMLATPRRTIYLFTSRDYGGLLDKEVSAETEGTLENFRLIDIVAK